MSAVGAVLTPWRRAELAAALFAVDPVGTGVALRGGPGAARDAWLKQLRDLVAPAPLRRIPASIADDRLLGGLDIAATLRAGRAIAEAGVLAQTDGGVLVVATAERLPAGAAARLSGALDRGSVGLERDGFALRFDARVGLVLLDEGLDADERPPAALIERMSFVVDIGAIGHRDVEPAAITAGDVAGARARLADVAIPDAVAEALVAVAARLGVVSLRGPILAMRTLRALCALKDRDIPLDEDVALAASLTLAPRATQLPADDDEPAEAEPQEPPPPQDDSEQPEPEDAAEDQAPRQLDDLVLAAARAAIPQDLLQLIADGVVARTRSTRDGKAGAATISSQRGRPLEARAGALREGRLGLVATLRAAAPWQKLRRGALADGDPRRVLVRPDDFRIVRFRQRRGATTVFVVDASGSAAMQRLAEVKGAIELLLADCYVRRDSVALVAFRGKGAEIVLPPTRSTARAKRALAGLPGGGGTPLASGIDAALALADQIRRKGQSPLLVLMTDGRANIGRNGAPGRTEAMADALDASRRVRFAGVAALAIDTAPPSQRAETAPTQRIAEALHARYVKLPVADAARVNAVVRAATGR